jgi:hypothetical protein
MCSAANASLLADYCNQYNGKVFKGYKCPKSKIPLPIKTCEFKNKTGTKQFFNGCSGPSGGHSTIFFPSCIQHDLCYHHEPISNGYAQSKCDYNFLQGMLKACEKDALNISRCKKWAKIMYRGVRVIGKPAFHCANYPAEY